MVVGKSVSYIEFRYMSKVEVSLILRFTILKCIEV
jgi:hypothetical protein